MCQCHARLKKFYHLIKCDLIWQVIKQLLPIALHCTIHDVIIYIKTLQSFTQSSMWWLRLVDAVLSLPLTGGNDNTVVQYAVNHWLVGWLVC